MWRQKPFKIPEELSNCLVKQEVRKGSTGIYRTHILRVCLICSEEKWITAATVRRSIKKFGTFTGLCHLCRDKSRIYKIGSSHPKWKGGRGIINGYVWLLLPDHPMASSRGRVAEHRIVVAEKIGRSLFNSEHVHHINGIRTDNRPENLELWENIHPTGKRVVDSHCKTCTCKP